MVPCEFPASAIRTVHIGAGGLQPPTQRYYDTGASDSSIDLNALCRAGTCPDLLPASNGIDFMEALEGSRVSMTNPVVTGPTSRNGGTWVLPDGGFAATSVSPGGLAHVGLSDSGGRALGLADADFNPEAVQIGGGAGVRVKRAGAGQRHVGHVAGVVDYVRGSYLVRLVSKIEWAAAPAGATGGQKSSQGDVGCG